MSEKAAPVGPVYLTFKDKPRQISFSIGALARLETELKIAVEDIVKYINDDPKTRINHLIDILWIGILDNDPDITRAQLAALIPATMTIGELADQILGQVKAAAGTEEPKN